MSVLTNSNTIQTTSKVSQATSSSKINTSDDDWAKFADEYDSYDISLDDNSRRKWRATMNVNVELAKICIRVSIHIQVQMNFLNTEKMMFLRDRAEV